VMESFISRWQERQDTIPGLTMIIRICHPG
jgi:hypothetical protein